MTRITMIIIFLIVISICVTCLEVLLRFAILQSKGRGSMNPDMATLGMDKVGVVQKLARVGPPSYKGPSLLAARGLVWLGSGVKGLFT